MKTAAIYIRVSSSKKVSPSPIGKIEDKFLQNPKVQLEPLIKLVQSRGWRFNAFGNTIFNPGSENVPDSTALLYEDRMSGASTSRPAYKRLMEDARRGKFQVVVVWRFDRFARSTKELINALEEFRSLGIDFVSHQEAVDTSTPAGRMMFTMIAAFAEFERDIIRERIMSGVEYAKAYGTKSGKAIGRPNVVFKRSDIPILYEAGYSVRAIAEKLGVGQGTVWRAIKAFQNAIAQKDRMETLAKELTDR